MNASNVQIWFPALALLLGVILHSLSDDGGANLLAHFGSSYRLPTKIIPIGILVFGVGSGTIDAVLAGSDWRHAAVTAIMTALGTLGGATLQNGLVNKTGAGGAGAVLLFFALNIAGVEGCTPAQTATGKAIGITIADGVCKELANQPEPEWVVLACAVEAGAVALSDSGIFGEASTVTVKIPRAQWLAIRSPITRTFPDASPGK